MKGLNTNSVDQIMSLMEEIAKIFQEKLSVIVTSAATRVTCIQIVRIKPAIFCSSNARNVTRKWRDAVQHSVKKLQDGVKKNNVPTIKSMEMDLKKRSRSHCKHANDYHRNRLGSELKPCFKTKSRENTSISSAFILLLEKRIPNSTKEQKHERLIKQTV